MVITLSKGEMLERFRLAGGFGHIRSDCAVEITDGVDLDGIIAEQLRRRYTELLSGGERASLAVTDLSPHLTEFRRLREGLGVLVLPADCTRLFDIQLEGWTRPAAVEPEDALAGLHMSLANVYTSPSPEQPRAVLGPGGREVYVHPLMACKAVSAMGVLDPGPEKYVLEESALTQLFESVNIELP